MAQARTTGGGHDSFPTFFITVCCQERGRNQLATDEMWSFLYETIERRNRECLWNCTLFVAMPDHIHGIFSFEGEGQMKDVIPQWKRWVSRQKGIAWQRGFFDHRLRSTTSEMEKRSYVLQNPVRAGLVEEISQWPYLYDPCK